MLPAPGVAAAGSVGERCVVERTHCWLNDFGRLRRGPERRAAMVYLYLFLAATIVVIRMLLRATVKDFQWPTRSTSRRLR